MIKINEINKNQKQAFLDALYEHISIKKGDSYLVNEKSLSEKYGVSIDDIIEIEKRAILMESDIKDSKTRRLVILDNLNKHGLNYYDEVDRIKSDFTDAIIVKDGKILFLKRNKEQKFEPEKWCLPGGHLEKAYADNIQRNIIKEVKEETGLNLLSKQLVSIKSINGGNKIYYFYCKVPPEENVVLNEREHTSYKWMNIDEIQLEPNESFILDLKDYLIKILNV